MNNGHAKYICPACGYDGLDKPAYRPEEDYKNGTPSFEICSSCGFQPGYTDDAIHFSHMKWREKWIAGGMIWDKGRSTPPTNWNPHEQLLNIGVKA